MAKRTKKASDNGKAAATSTSETIMEREDRQRGFFIAFGFTPDAEQECANYHKRTGRVIKLITVQEILDEQHVQKM